MSNVIELRNLQKHFPPEAVLKGVDLCVREHSVLGLLGVNAAGKTTLLRCALGLFKPTGGEAIIYGGQAWDMPPEVKNKIGFVPQVPDLFDWMTAEQMLKYNAAFYKNWNQKYAMELLFKWEVVASMRIKNMSEGQKQRLAIVLAMGHSPDLLVLDEPVAALDPLARREFIRQLIELNADEGKTILFSTHIVSDLERIAAEVAIIKDGQVHYQGEIDTLKEQIVRLKILAKEDLPANLPIDKQLSVSISGRVASVCVQDFDSSRLESLKRELKAEIEIQQLGLEDIFLELNRK